MRQKIKRKCEECSDYFETNILEKKYCSRKCKGLRSRKIYLLNNPPSNVCSGTLGAISEYKIIVDLLSKNYHVYKSASPSCPADLAITFENKLYRVEVTTGYLTNAGKIHHQKSDKDKEKFEILAIVMKDGRIFYEPDLPS